MALDEVDRESEVERIQSSLHTSPLHGVHAPSVDLEDLVSEVPQEVAAIEQSSVEEEMMEVEDRATLFRTQLENDSQDWIEAGDET